MTTIQDLTVELRARLKDNAIPPVWEPSDLRGYVVFAIKGLYPNFYKRDVAWSTAATGPIQKKPDGVVNIYSIGHLRRGSQRVRPLRGWMEGDTTAVVPKTGIESDTLVWGFTKPFTIPANDTTTLDLPSQAEEVVLLRAHIAALEALLTSRVRAEKYFALNVREASTEDDVRTAIDALAASVEDRLRTVQPLPEAVR